MSGRQLWRDVGESIPGKWKSAQGLWNRKRPGMFQGPDEPYT